MAEENDFTLAELLSELIFEAELDSWDKDCSEVSIKVECDPGTSFETSMKGSRRKDPTVAAACRYENVFKDGGFQETEFRYRAPY